MSWADENGDFVSDNNPYTIEIKGDTYLKAIFETVQYEVVADADQGGTAELDDVSPYNCDELATFTATADDC